MRSPVMWAKSHWASGPCEVYGETGFNWAKVKWASNLSKRGGY